MLDLTFVALGAGTFAVLDQGADDYVEKPFSIGELLARIRVALGHATPTLPSAPEQQFGEIRFDLLR